MFSAQVSDKMEQVITVFLKLVWNILKAIIIIFLSQTMKNILAWKSGLVQFYQSARRALEGFIHSEATRTNPILRELLPFDLAEIGFEEKVLVPSQSGKYIVHIGQMHSSGDRVLNLLHPEISKSQRAIEQLLRRSEIRVVFTEGMSEQNPKLESLLQKIRNIPFNEQTGNILRQLWRTPSQAHSFLNSSISMIPISKPVNQMLRNTS